MQLLFVSFLLVLALGAGLWAEEAQEVPEVQEEEEYCIKISCRISPCRAPRGNCPPQRL